MRPRVSKIHAGFAVAGLLGFLIQPDLFAAGHAKHIVVVV